MKEDIEYCLRFRKLDRDRKRKSYKKNSIYRTNKKMSNQKRKKQLCQDVNEQLKVINPNNKTNHKNLNKSK